MTFKTPNPLINKWTDSELDKDIDEHNLQGLTPEYTQAIRNRLSQRIKDSDLYTKVKDLLNKADIDFKDDPSWENKVDFIREGLKDDLNIDEDISQIYLKGKNLYGLQTFPEGEPKEKVLYKWN